MMTRRERQQCRCVLERYKEEKQDMTSQDEQRAPAIITEVQKEMERQVKLWGRQDHGPLMWHAILDEEKGEAAKAMLEGAPVDYRTELIHVAAVALSAIQSLDDNGWWDETTEIRELHKRWLEEHDERVRLEERLKAARSEIEAIKQQWAEERDGAG